MFPLSQTTRESPMRQLLRCKLIDSSLLGDLDAENLSDQLSYDWKLILRNGLATDSTCAATLSQRVARPAIRGAETPKGTCAR